MITPFNHGFHFFLTFFFHYTMFPAVTAGCKSPANGKMPYTKGDKIVLKSA